MPPLPPDLVQAYLIPIGAAVAAGGLIGLEREWRGHPAGLRTHILVCLASTLLMLGRRPSDGLDDGHAGGGHPHRSGAHGPAC